MNPLYSQFGNRQPNNLINQFMKFRKNFNGNPQQTVQELLNSGKVSQVQYNKAVQMANQIQNMIGRM